MFGFTSFSAKRITMLRDLRTCDSWEAFDSILFATMFDFVGILLNILLSLLDLISGIA